MGVEKEVVIVKKMKDKEGEMEKKKEVMEWKRGEVEKIKGKKMK